MPIEVAELATLFRYPVKSLSGESLEVAETNDPPAIAITNHNERCAKVSLDPDSAHRAVQVLKAIVRVRDNKAGGYATITRRRRLALG